MSPTYGVIPHRLKGTVVGLPSDAVNISVVNTAKGGFGTCDFDTFSDPGLAKRTAIEFDVEGGRVFEGKVASVTSGVGPQDSWHVSCVGHFDEFKEDETVEGVFVDRDLSQWVATDCNNWGVWPEGQINVDASEGLNFLWPDVDKLTCYQSETGTAYEHIGNSLPHWDDSDFPAPPKLWSAAYYKLAGSKTITGLSFQATCDFTLGFSYIFKKTPDYTNPIGPADEKYGHRFAKYPRIDYWAEFYGRGYDANGVANCPSPYYLGVYVCDDVGDLPFADPIAMRTDSHLLQRFEWSIYDFYQHKNLRFACAGKLIVFYAAYLPVRLPHNLGTKYSKNADHLVRTKWVARNRLYACASNSPISARITDVSVYSQGYESGADGSDDLADVFTILFPTGSFESMKLPAPDEDTAPTSIVLRPDSRTLCAAVPELLSLYPEEVQYGWWEDKVLTIAHDPGSASISDAIGVDTTGAATSDEGAVDLVQVAFCPTVDVAPKPGEMLVPVVKQLVVDKDGAYSLVPDDWQPAAGQRVAYKDATSEASSEIAAARIGQSIAIERREGQWTGSVGLTAIVGASQIRPGKTLGGAGISGALITQTTLNVGGDQVTLALGATGYHGRFPARVAGKPNTAAPGDGRDRGRQNDRGRSGGRRR
jgi:hypothetical protein